MTSDALSTAGGHLGVLSRGDWDVLARSVRGFVDALRRGERPDIIGLLPGGDPVLRRAVLVEMIHEELEFRLKEGESAGAEEYLARFPELSDDPVAVRDLARAELRLKRSSPLATTVVGGRFGRFEVLEELGRGSFGVVHRCRDTALGRMVAVKVPRPGTLASPEVEDRFLGEARSAARLSHPHIVALHEAGRIDGIPYLVSAYIAGTTLAEWAAAEKPTPRQAAAVVAALADALQHAHGHGVIHRDIKPSNILIDAEGRPHLTDFGLARAHEDGGRRTRDGDVLGTPAYMPPEQARGDAHRVDARGDVYSLGVILYELQTGTLPFRGPRWLLLRQVLEDEPCPPRRLNDAIPRDLETVCLKAMAKEPGRRYPTASEFADDLARFLRDEPVRARPVRPLTALARRCRRKPLLSGTAAALALTLALGTALFHGERRRAEGFRLQAMAQIAEARQQRSQRLQTLDSGYRTTLRLTHLVKARSRSELDAAGGSETADAILHDLHGFLAQLRIDPASRTRLGSALSEYAEVASGLGRREAASVALQEARGVFEELLRREPNSAPLLGRLGECHRGLCHMNRDAGRIDDAVRHARLASEHWRRAIDLSRRWLQLHPCDIVARTELAHVELHLGFLLLQEGGPLPEALRVLEAARESCEQVCRASTGDVSARATLAQCLASLGDWYQASGRWAEARDVLEQTRDAWDNLLRTHPGVDQFRRSLAQCEVTLAIVHRAEGNPDAAHSACEQATAIWEDLLRRDPSNLNYLWGRARACFWRGAVLEDLGRPAEALRNYESAADLFARPDPALTPKRGLLATSYHVIGRLRNDLGLPAESALAALREALKLREALRSQPDNAPSDQSNCAGTWQRLGETLERLGRDDEAVSAYRQAIVLQSTACAREPSHRKYACYLDDHRAHLARLERKLDAVHVADRTR